MFIQVKTQTDQTHSPDVQTELNLCCMYMPTCPIKHLYYTMIYQTNKIRNFVFV